jgi:hypothetical protein
MNRENYPAKKKLQARLNDIAAPGCYWGGEILF